MAEPATGFSEALEALRTARRVRASKLLADEADALRDRAMSVAQTAHDFPGPRPLGWRLRDGRQINRARFLMRREVGAPFMTLERHRPLGDDSRYVAGAADLTPLPPWP